MATRRKSTNKIEPVFSLEDTAIVMFKTNYQNYEMAMHLNDTFGLHLARMRKDLKHIDGPHAYYSYYDSYRRLTYLLIDCAQSPTQHSVFSYYDKMLLIRGFDNWNTQDQILQKTKFGMPEPEPHQLCEYRHWKMCQEMRTRIFDANSFCFSQNRGLSSSIFPNNDLPKHRKVVLFLDTMQAYLKELFVELEYAIDGNYDIDTQIEVPIAEKPRSKGRRIVLEL